MTNRKEETIVKYGAVVIADTEIEAMRNDGCLCLRCVRLVTQADVEAFVVDEDPAVRKAHIERMKKAFNCPVAQRLYEACVDGDVATPVTRCPLYVEREAVAAGPSK